MIDVVSDADLPLLTVAAAHADMVGLSFLRHEGDVDVVHEYLRRVRAEHLGIILKIETTAAFASLPEILLHAMRSPFVGVMIARGDLAVEAGYERLAEVQEEIMWLCEAAHLPVVWATESSTNWLAPDNHSGPRLLTQPWLNERSASCSTRVPMSVPPSWSSTTSFAAWLAINGRRRRCCARCTAGVTTRERPTSRSMERVVGR